LLQPEESDLLRAWAVISLCKLGQKDYVEELLKLLHFQNLSLYYTDIEPVRREAGRAIHKVFNDGSTE